MALYDDAARAAGRRDNAPFDPPGRLGVTAGACAAGALLGAGAAFTLGRVEPGAALLALAGLAAVALVFAVWTFLDDADCGDRSGALLIGMHIVLLAAWPAMLLIAPGWAALALAGALVLLVLYASFARPSGANVGRLALVALLAGGAGAYELVNAAMA